MKLFFDNDFLRDTVKGVKGYEKFQDNLRIQQELRCPHTSVLLLTFH